MTPCSTPCMKVSTSQIRLFEKSLPLHSGGTEVITPCFERYSSVPLARPCIFAARFFGDLNHATLCHLPRLRCERVGSGTAVEAPSPPAHEQLQMQSTLTEGTASFAPVRRPIQELLPAPPAVSQQGQAALPCLCFSRHGLDAGTPNERGFMVNQITQSPQELLQPPQKSCS